MIFWDDFTQPFLSRVDLQILKEYREKEVDLRIFFKVLWARFFGDYCVVWWYRCCDVTSQQHQ